METTAQNTQTQLHPIIHDILIKRNIAPEQFSDFFSWNLRELPDLQT
jgi:hypothetical protein